MLKRTIEYEDFDGNKVSEDFYFHMSKAELVELEVSEKQGFAEYLQEIVKASDGKTIIETFKKLILMAVGERSEDGRRFIKSQEIRDDFENSPAYSELFVELATDANKAAEFVNGIVPAGMQQDVTSLTDKLPKTEEASAPVLEEAKDVEAEPDDPTEKEMREMSREDLIAAYKAKMQARSNG